MDFCSQIFNFHCIYSMEKADQNMFNGEREKGGIGDIRESKEVNGVKL